jgi:hypothetical protein
MGVLMDIRATRSHRGTGAIQGEARPTVRSGPSSKSRNNDATAARQMLQRR